MADSAGGLALLERVFGDDIVILNLPGSSIAGDFDVATVNQDPNWPLRLHEPWRLLQVFRHDVGAWYFILNNGAQSIPLDMLHDPLGIGRDGFATADLGVRVRDFGLPALRAVYLTQKRVRKRALGEDWSEAVSLVHAHESESGALIRECFGHHLGRRIHDDLLRRGMVSNPVRNQMRLRIWTRRLAHPIAYVGGTIDRLVERLFRPSGLMIVLGGPDGSGKSTLASALLRRSDRFFRGSRLVHWRPKVLPAQSSEASAHDPYSRPPDGVVRSLLRIAYYWADFLIGGWFGWFPSRRKSSLVIVERWWLDMLIDPGRYALHPFPRLLTMLQAFLPRPDLLIVAAGRPEEIVGRKKELSLLETTRQVAAWTAHARKARGGVVIQSSDVGDAINATQTLVTDYLASRAAARIGYGWARIPLAASGWIPRGPRRAAHRSMSLIQPSRWKPLLAWRVTRALVGLGGLRVLPRSDAPPQMLRFHLAEHVSPGGTYSAVQGRGTRFLVYVFDEAGSTTAFMKIAMGPDDSLSLKREARNLQSIATKWPVESQLPTLLDEGDGFLKFKPVEYQRSLIGWNLDESLAHSCGIMFGQTARPTERGLAGAAHGDFAPWNVLRSEDGVCLVDWEHAGLEYPIFFDVFHYVIQASGLLGRPPVERILEALNGAGPVGGLLKAYARGAGVSFASDQAREALHDYLDLSALRLHPSEANYEAAMNVRNAIRDRLLERI